MWIKPLKAVVASELLPRPAYWTHNRKDRYYYLVTLECGHQIKRVVYGQATLPARCKCSKCGHSDM